MTMPDERLRAVLWGAELLEQTASDTSLPDTIIAAAKRIALRYPTLEALEEQFRSCAAGLPSEWTIALLEALQLFEEMKIGAVGSAATRTDLMYALRHFPDRMTIRAMSRTSKLEQWLQRPAEQQVQQSAPLDASPFISVTETRGLLADSFATRQGRLDSDEMLTMDQAAELLGTTRMTVENWISEGRAIGLSQNKGGCRSGSSRSVSGICYPRCRAHVRPPKVGRCSLSWKRRRARSRERVRCS